MISGKIGENELGNFITITDDVEIGDNCEIESISSGIQWWRKREAGHV